MEFLGPFDHFHRERCNAMVLASFFLLIYLAIHDDIFFMIGVRFDLFSGKFGRENGALALPGHFKSCLLPTERFECS